MYFIYIKISVLNDLVALNNERIVGYKKAYENTFENDLKTMFSRFAQTSQMCRHGLINEVKKLGGRTVEGTRVSGKFFQTWMDVKSELTGKDRKAILTSCEQGEENAIEMYRDVFQDISGHFDNEQQIMIKTQYSWLESDLSKIRSMRNNLGWNAQN